MLPPLPRCSSWAYSSLIHPAVSAFPERGVGSACTSSFSGLAQRSLTLRPAHSRGHLFVTRYPKASDISSPPCLLRLLPAGAISPGGACTRWKAPPCHGAHPKATFMTALADRREDQKTVVRRDLRLFQSGAVGSWRSCAFNRSKSTALRRATAWQVIDRAALEASA